MALNFPNSPTVGQVYTDSTSGFSYEWDGTVWKSYSAASSSQIKVLDDISASFNGSTQTFALTSSGNAFTPASAQSLVINLGGVIQDPSDDYSVSSSNIIFSTAPSSGLTFSGISLGPAIPITTILDGTTTQGAFNVAGNLNVTGIATANTFVGQLNSSGVSTVANLQSTNINATGIVTATGGFNIGIQSAGTNVTTGVITALNFVGTGNTFTYNAGTKTVNISIAGGGGSGATLDITASLFI